MCGINGIYAFQMAANPPKEAELLATREYMRSRGPDGAGAWWNEDRRLGLGHRRLSIIDLSERASQPMVSDDGKLVVVFNGEIYNYRTLRSELEAAGVRFRTTSDTEALLHLYARDGADMVHLLRGMYAFAIWDDDRRGLFLARDPYGIKPLYTANDGWTFRFASQVKALLAGGYVSRDPEPAGLVGFHLFGSVPEPFTLYREIRALPAGHTQWVDSVGPREPKQFANLAAILAGHGSPAFNIAQLGAQVRSTVQESVRLHLQADVEVGVFLSGGVDSGALLGLMKDSGQTKMHAITLAFEEFRGTAEDEAPFAAQTAQRFGAEHIIRYVSESEFKDDLPAILGAMDQPSIDGVNTWFVAKATREAGFKVALSGLGGDELLAGYSSFADLPRWRRRFGPLARIPGLGILSRGLLGIFASRLARTTPKALGILEYAGSWQGAYLLRRGLFLPHELKRMLEPELVREGLRRLKPLSSLVRGLNPDPNSDVARVCALESMNYMRNQLLRDADWAGMAHSLEIRVPFVDVALLSSLAPAMATILPGMGKKALADAPALPLPDEVLSRAKTGFGVPTEEWLNAALDEESTATAHRAESKGLISRRWSQRVISELGASSQRPAGVAA